MLSHFLNNAPGSRIIEITGLSAGYRGKPLNVDLSQAILVAAANGSIKPAVRDESDGWSRRTFRGYEEGASTDVVSQSTLDPTFVIQKRAKDLGFPVLSRPGVMVQ